MNESKGYAIAFLVVLCIIGAGTYVAVSAILGHGRDALPVSDQPTPTTVRIADVPTATRPLATNTPVVIPTIALPTPTLLPPTNTPAPPTPTPVETPTPTPTNTPSGPTPAPIPPTPSGDYTFHQDGPVRPGSAPGCGIFGYVRDAQGTLLQDIRVNVSNEWGFVIPQPARSKPVDAPDAGYYDVTLNLVPGRWYAVVVDESGNEISPVVTVTRADESAPCLYQLDWRRTY